MNIYLQNLKTFKGFLWNSLGNIWKKNLLTNLKSPVLNKNYH